MLGNGINSEAVAAEKNVTISIFFHFNINSKAVAACQNVSRQFFLLELRGIGQAHLLHLGPEDATFESFKIPDMKTLGPAAGQR